MINKSLQNVYSNFQNEALPTSFTYFETKKQKKTTKMINKNTMKRECSNGKLSTSVKKGGQFSTNHGINIGSLA